MELNIDTLSDPVQDADSLAGQHSELTSLSSKGPASPHVTEDVQKCISSSSADATLKQSEENTEDTFLSEGSTLTNSSVTDESYTLSQQLSMKNGDETTCQPDLESKDHQDVLLISSAQGTSALVHQSLNPQPSDKLETVSALSPNMKCDTDEPHIQNESPGSSESAERESCVDGKISPSSEMESDVDGKVFAGSAPASDIDNSHQYSLVTGENIPSALNHTETLRSCEDISSNLNHSERDTLQTAEEQLATEFRSHRSSDGSQVEDASPDNLVDDTSPSDKAGSLQDSDEGQRQPTPSDTQMSGREQTTTETKSGTGYLDGVIASIQSLNWNQPEADKDVVKISRAELTFMVEQTLTAQTVCNYMQDLVQKNKTLNKQNEVLKDTIVHTKKCAGQEREHPNSVPVICQGTETQVFRFPESLPPVRAQWSQSSSPPASPHKGQQSAEGEDTASMLQADGDLNSASLQLSSHIHFDSDHSLSQEVSAAGKNPQTGSTTAAGASVPAPEPLPHNIPHSELFAEAQVYSLGPQQHDENVVGSAGVSQDQLKRVLDELERVKLFLHKIMQEGGIHPGDVQELVNLREKVKNLQEENAKLKLELQNKPDPIVGTGRCGPRQEEQIRMMRLEISSLKEKIEQQKKREHDVLNMLAKLGAEKNLVKSSGPRPPSQPPSSVGLQALPPIVTATIECQTEQQVVSTQLYHTEVAKLKDQLNQARNSDAEAKETLQKLYSDLKTKNEHNSHLQKSVYGSQQEVQGLKKHCDELAQQIKDLSREIDTEKRKHSQEAERNKKLETMIGDERRRYARDEKELLDRVKMLTKMTKDVPTLKRLVLAVDQSRKHGFPLSEEHADQLVKLWQQESPGIAATMLSPSVRTASPRGGASDSASSSSFRQHQRTTESVSAGTASRVPQRGGGRLQASGHGAQGQGHSSGSHGSSNVAAALFASLPSRSSGQADQLYPEQPGSQENRNRPLQRSNLGNSATSVSSSGSGVHSSRQRRQ